MTIPKSHAATSWVFLAGLIYQVILEPILRGIFPGHFDSGLDVLSLGANVAGSLGMAAIHKIGGK